MGDLNLSQAVDLAAVMARTAEERAKQLPIRRDIAFYVLFQKQKRHLTVELSSLMRPAAMMNF